MTHQRYALITSALFAILSSAGCVDDAAPGPDGPPDVRTDPVSADQISLAAQPAPGTPVDRDPCGPNAYDIGVPGAPQCICAPGALRCGTRCLASDEQRVVDDQQRAEVVGRCLTAPSCYGQTFTPTHDGWLTELSFDGDADGRQLLSIYEGVANGCGTGGLVLLHEQDLDAMTLGIKQVRLTFPVAVQAGTTYTFKVSGDGYWEHGCSAGDVYKSGAFIASHNSDIAFSTTIAMCP